MGMCESGSVRNSDCVRIDVCLSMIKEYWRRSIGCLVGWLIDCRISTINRSAVPCNTGGAIRCLLCNKNCNDANNLKIHRSRTSYASGGPRRRGYDRIG